MNTHLHPAQAGTHGIGGASSAGVIAALTVMLLAASIGMQASLHEIHVSWTGKYGHFAHGYMVLAFCLWLGVRAWRQRGGLLLNPDWRALPVLLVLLGMLAVAMRLDITTATQSLVPAILICASALAFGMELIRLIWWAAACIYFAMPVWYLLNTPLQELTGFVCRLLVAMVGLPAIVDGNQFELPSGIIEVASGCSGLNYLVSALSLAYLYAMMFLQTWPARMKLLCVAVIAALVVNWVRVFSLICIAYATDMRHYLIRVDHLYFGWLLFVLALWPIFWAGARLDGQEARQGIAEPRLVATGPLSVLLPRVLAAACVASACMLMPLLV